MPTTGRAYATNSISFGLVNVPVKLHASVESHDVAFHQYHVHDDGSATRINKVSKCQQCAQLVDYGDLQMGVELDDGKPIIITDDEKREVEVDAGKDFEVLAFVNPDEVDPLTFESSYWLEPDVKRGKTAPKGYALLRRVMEDDGLVAVARYTLRGKTHMTILRPVRGTLVAQNVLWSDELRTPNFPSLDKPIELNPAELAAAKKLVATMVEKYDPTQYVDTYTNQLGELVAAKSTGGVYERPEQPVNEPTVDDLLAKLQASIKRQETAK